MRGRSNTYLQLEKASVLFTAVVVVLLLPAHMTHSCRPFSASTPLVSACSLKIPAVHNPSALGHQHRWRGCGTAPVTFFNPDLVEAGYLK